MSQLVFAAEFIYKLKTSGKLTECRIHTKHTQRQLSDKIQFIFDSSVYFEALNFMHHFRTSAFFTIAAAASFKTKRQSTVS